MVRGDDSQGSSGESKRSSPARLHLASAFGSKQILRRIGLVACLVVTVGGIMQIDVLQGISLKTQDFTAGDHWRLYHMLLLTPVAVFGFCLLLFPRLVRLPRLSLAVLGVAFLVSGLNGSYRYLLLPYSRANLNDGFLRATPDQQRWCDLTSDCSRGLLGIGLICLFVSLVYPLLRNPDKGTNPDKGITPSNLREGPKKMIP
jgi:hypothetical protein